MKKEYIVIIYGVIALVIIIFLTAILRKLGIFKTKDKKEEIANVAKIQTVEYFNPAYYKTVNAFKPLGFNLAQKLAHDLRKALRGFGTDENEIYSVFNQLYNKTNISELSEVYYTEYKRDMKADILNDLNKKETSMLMEIIDKKPDRA